MMQRGRHHCSSYGGRRSRGRVACQHPTYALTYRMQGWGGGLATPKLLGTAVAVLAVLAIRVATAVTSSVAIQSVSDTALTAGTAANTELYGLAFKTRTSLLFLSTAGAAVVDAIDDAVDAVNAVTVLVAGTTVGDPSGEPWISPGLVIWRGGHRMMTGRGEPGGEPWQIEGLPIVDIVDVGEAGPKDTA